MSAAVLERDTTRVRAGNGKQRLRAVVLSAALLAVAAGAAWYGHYWWTAGRFIQSTDDAYVGGDVTVIAPKVSGLITQVAVIDDQAVRAGDLLVKIDGRDYRAVAASVQSFQKGDALYKEAAAAGLKARAALLAAQRQLDVIDTQKQQVRAQLAQAQADYELAQIDVRYTELRAQIDGTIGNRSARAGGFASVGARRVP